MEINSKKYVDLLLNNFKNEFNNNDRGGVYGYTQRLMAYNSNKIEGSKLSLNQTASLFDTKIETEDVNFLNESDDEEELSIVMTKDIEEARGHFILFNDMLRTYNENLTEQLIKKYHHDLKSGVFEDIANGYAIGDYKKRANTVSTIKVALPHEVPGRMRELLAKYSAKDTHDLEDIVKFHAEYETIHPFQDGNGRTGRMIMFKECLKNNIFPFIIEDDLKAAYYTALNKAQVDKKYDDLMNLCLKEQLEYFKNIQKYIHIPTEFNGLNENMEDSPKRR